MSADRPWEAGPFSKWVKTELNNRIDNLSSGINQTPTENNGMTYVSGPRRHWIKVFSNGLNKRIDTPAQWGLLLKSPDVYSDDIFADRYGIAPQQQIYGYSNKGFPKFVTNPQFRTNVPEPGITSFTADVQKNFFITAKINWVCHSIDQLNAITPYLLTPLVTVFVEWGWNNFNVASLINYDSVDELKRIVKNHFEHYDTRVPLSYGNYDFMVGDITNFEYGFDDNVIKGFTEIRSRQMLYSGFNVRGDKSINVGSQNDTTQSPALSFKTTFQQTLKTLVAFSENGELPVPPDPEKTTNPDRALDDENIKLYALLTPYKDKYGPKLNNLPNYVYKFPSRSKPSGLLQQEGKDNSTLDTYITLELFVDIMNSLKNKNSQKEYLKDFFEVDVVNSNVGYHENLISTSKDVLIPNVKAPKFNGRGSVSYNRYKDEVTTFIGDDKAGTNTATTRLGQIGSVINDFITGAEDQETVKKGQSEGESMLKSAAINEKINLFNIEKERKSLKTHPSDIQLKLLIGYGKTVYRNDLDFVLNKYGRSLIQTRNDTGFDSRGLLKNVYVNLNFIIESLVVNDDVINMKDMYDALLKELNESVCDFWNLELVNVDSVNPNVKKTGGLQIVDVKYKTSAFNIGDIFTFDYGSNRSIVKKINFTTSLTNGMANQILYRSFGEKSLSSNNLIDFSNEGIYVDRIKDEEKDKKSIDGNIRNTTNSDQMLTFLNVIKKYMNFQPANPDASFLMRVQVYKSSSGKVEERVVGAGGGGMGGVTTYSVKVANFNEYNIADLFIPDKEALVYLLNDYDKKNNTNVYCAPIRNVELEISLMGIAGIRVFEFFRVKNLPPPFTENVVVFQVRDVTHTIDENGWETRIKASVRPSYNLFSEQFFGDVNINPTVQNLV